jgi:DNA-binding NarL/FixJ family response regulator
MHLIIGAERLNLPTGRSVDETCEGDPMSSAKIKLVVAEDNFIIRAGIRKLLNKSQDIEVVGEATNGVEALQLVQESKPDILLLDVEMPVLNGIEVAWTLKESKNMTKILVLSAYDDQEYIRGMLLNGASGYLLKDEAPERIIDAVKGVAQGETGWVSPQVEARLKKKRKKENNKRP